MQTTSQYIDEYRIIKTLGSGYHAQVFLAEATDKSLVAIKKFKQSTATLSTLKHQLSIMKNLKHQNLVNLIDVRQNAVYKSRNGAIQKCFGIILEYVGGGELFDFIAIAGKFSEVVTRTYFYQLMNAIHYMHEKGYAHRDIKPQNILLASNYQLKLADFGFATLLQGKDKTFILHTKLGTEGYMAPEIQTKNYQGKSADIFSCGVILFIMYTATPPFQKSVPNDFYYRLIKNKEYQTFWGYHSKRRAPGFFSDSFKDIIQKMLAYNPNQRPSVMQISQHPWTKGKVLSIQSLKQQFDIRKAAVDNENQKQRLQKQKQKMELKNAIFNTDKKVKRSGVVDDFNDIYEAEVGTTRNLQLKTQEAPGDFIISQSEDFIFSTLILYFKKTVEDFKPTFRIEGSKIFVKYEKNLETETQGEAQEKVGVEIELELWKKDQPTKEINQEKKKEDGKVIFTFKKIEGSFIYYKRLVHLIQQEFSYCGRKV